MDEQKSPAPDNSSQSAVLKIALIQFFFMVSWVLYGIYFADLLAAAGIDRSWLVPIFLFDQLLFAVMDPLIGAWADRVERRAKKLVPWVVGLNALAAVAFVSLPLIGVHSSALLLMATLVWVVSASALRAPLFVMLDRLPGAPNQTSRIAQAAAGIALGSALAPFLGLGLKGVSPIVPFVVSSGVLLVAGLALPALPARNDSEKAREQHRSEGRPLVWVYGVTFLLACGFQFHVFVGSVVLYRQFVSSESLPWCLPVFWVGFKLMMFMATGRVEKAGAAQFLSWMAAAGGVALLLCLLAPNLPVLLLGQVVLGACWGGCFVAGIRTVQGWPTRMESGLALGGWFCMLSLATAGRIGLDKMIAADALALEAVAVVLWLLAAALGWGLLARGRAVATVR